MEQEKIFYEGKDWNWPDLDRYIEDSISAIDQGGKSRKAIALGMAEGDRILDVGCNVGINSAWLARRGHRVEAVDVDKVSLEIARRKHKLDNLNLSYYEGTSLDFPDGSFDCVLLLEVLEHTWHPRGLIKEIYRALKPGGHLVLSVPNAASYHTLARTLLLKIESYFRKMESWPEFTTDQRDHYYYWDPFTMYRLLNLQGFVYVEHAYHDNMKLFNAATRAVPYLKRISTSFLIKVRKT